MKKFVVLAAATMVMTFAANAATVALLCGNNGFTETYATPTPTLNSASYTCGPDAALNGLSGLSIAILLENDFSSGNPGTFPNSTATYFTSTAPGFTNVTLYATGGTGSNGYFNTENLAAATSNPNFLAFQNYFIDPLTSTNASLSWNVALTNAAGGATATGPGAAAQDSYTTAGSEQTASENVYIVYTYTTGTPEPVSMILLGSGLLAVSLIGRKKFAKK